MIGMKIKYQIREMIAKIRFERERFIMSDITHTQIYCDYTTMYV